MIRAFFWFALVGIIILYISKDWGLRAGASRGGGYSANGSSFEVKPYLVSGKMTVVDFYSDYCPPCRELAPRLDGLRRNRPDLHVVKIDINRRGVKGIDWNSPIIQQAGITGLPHIKIYSDSGRLVAEGDRALDMVEGWMR